MIIVPSMKTIEKRLTNKMVLPTDKKTLRAAGRAFRHLWQTKQMLEAGFPAVPGAPKVAPGSCIFAAAVARSLFGADIRGNWQHVWGENEHIIDLSGMADVPLDKAIVLHVAMLRERGYTVLGTGDGTWSVQLSYGDRKVDYPPVITSKYFEHEPYLLNDRDFRETIATVIPRAKKWADAIRAEIA